MTTFRRVFLHDGCVCVETAPGVVYYQPNPTEQNRWYNPKTVMTAVIYAGAVNLGLWKRFDPDRGVEL